jgi:microcystin-dependent protein
MNTQTKLTRIALGTALSGAALMGPASAYATCTDPSATYMGSICVTAANYCPRNYAVAAGQTMAISQYQALYSLLGTRYGGDGVSTFKLPDLRGRSVIGTGQGPGLDPVGLGQYRGKDWVTLTLNNLPTHNHIANFKPSGGGEVTVDIPVSSNTSGNKTLPDADYSYLAASPSNERDSAKIWSNTMTKAASVKGVTTSGGGGGGTVIVGNTGGGQAFPNVPPQLGMTYCILTDGLYPPHP